MNSLKENSFDPTTFSYLSPPTDQKNYNKDSFIMGGNDDNCKEKFTSLLFNGILNVSQVIGQGYYRNVSIPINPNKVKEKLSIQEIIADIVLYQLLTGDDDRDIIPTTDGRNSNTNINFHNCAIYNNGTYSIFDIYDEGPRLEKDEIIKKIIIYLRYLYDNPSVHEDRFVTLFCEPDNHNNNGKDGFFSRILKKVDEFINFYDGEEGKKFFLHKKVKSLGFNKFPHPKNLENETWYKEAIERYDNFIFTLKNIKDVLSQENMDDVVYDYLYYNLEFLTQEFQKSLKTTLRTGLQIIENIKIRIFTLLSIR